MKCIVVLGVRSAQPLMLLSDLSPFATAHVAAPPNCHNNLSEQISRGVAVPTFP